MPKPSIILVAEDDPAIRGVLQEKLAKAGYQLQVAANGKDALAVAREHHPDLVILDVLMPVMHGIDMLSELRQEPWGRSIPAIVLTNLDDNTVRARASELKAKYLLKAQTKLQILLTEITSALNTSHHG